MVRKAILKDARKIQQLINYYAEKGEMLPRALNEIYENIRDFFVYEKTEMERSEEWKKGRAKDRVSTVDYGLSTIIGVAALHIGLDGMAEIRSVAIDPQYIRRGIGSLLAKECLKEAKELDVKQVFLLTYRPQFFKKIGFGVVEKEKLPQKVWGDCVRCAKFPICDEIAMICKL